MGVLNEAFDGTLNQRTSLANMGPGRSIDIFMAHLLECHVRPRPRQEVEARLFL